MEQTDDITDLASGDCCRYCYMEATNSKPLFYPCHCSGSMRYVHQECLDRWLSHNDRPTCEVCGHRFLFKPIYKEDMPKHLPIRILITGLARTVFQALRDWFHYTLVAIAWLIVVPLSAYRIYKFIFNTYGVGSLLSLTGTLISPNNFLTDVFYGAFIVSASIAAFVALVWLREQIINGAAPDWMELHLARRGGAAVAPHAQGNHAVARNLRRNVAVQAPNNVEGANNGLNERQENNAVNVADVNNERMDEERPLLAQNNNSNDNTTDGAIGNSSPVNVADTDGKQQVSVDVPSGSSPGTSSQSGGEVETQTSSEGPAEQERVETLVDDEDEDEAESDHNEHNENENENEVENENHAGDIFEQAAEELTWDRMLGLDGSLVFLEHVFWVISINGIFVFLFVYCPYNLGRALCFLLSVSQIMENIEGFVFLVFGYVAIAFGSLLMYLCAAYLGKRQLSKIFGIMYITMKVVLLMLVEIGLFPLLAGVWIDICTLALFDVPWSQRAEGFSTSPITSIFIHWMVGMVFVFYYASFIITLREILRPGVLWFMRNFTDPEFNPVFEMIRLPILSHVRRFLLSGTVFGTTCMLALLFPVMTIKNLVPKFLPYQISLVTDAPVSELSMELLLLQVILPALLDQGHIQSAVKISIIVWTKAIGSCLDLRSYLLGANDGPIFDFKLSSRDNNNNEGFHEIPRAQQPHNANNNQGENINNNNQQNAAAAGGGLQAAHLALLQVNISDEPQEYKRPRLFALRIVALIVLTMLTVYVLSTVSLFVPTYVGRQLMSFWFGDLKIHELYTCAIGVYSCWAILRSAVCVFSWVSAGVHMFREKIRRFCVSLFKLTIASVFCIGVIPLLLGLFFDILVVMPLRLSIDQTPIFFLWQSWALGILHSKIFCAITLIGPNWWLKTVIERLGRNGLADLSIEYLLRKLVCPVVTVLVVLLSTPYFLAFVLVPLVSNDPILHNMVYRRFYHIILSISSAVMFFVVQIRQMKKLYVKIKNDRYLIGQRLQNFEREKEK